MRHVVVQSARRASGRPSVPSLAQGQHLARGAILAAPGTPAAAASSRRTFISFNDLAKLSPFGSSSSSSSHEQSSGKRRGNAQVYHETVTLPFTRAQLFDVVSDVARYEQFVPYCTGSRIIAPSTEMNAIASAGPTRTRDESTSFLAELTVGFGQLNESYTSKVTLINQSKVVAEATPTPLFQQLRTSWIFASVDGSTEAPTTPRTRVDFEVEYAFANPVYAALARSAMDKMARQMIGAFERRAAVVAAQGSRRQ